MSVVNFRNKLLSLLIEELESHIPQFKPYTLDHQLVLYASRDLETWLKVKLNTDDNRVVYRHLDEYLRSRPEDLKVSINFWTGMWLKKWRERVRVLSTKFELPPDYAEKIRRARKLYQDMDYRGELKSMAIRKLINQGEICMVDFIAENIIIDEIAKRISRGNKNVVPIAINPLSIYNAVSGKIMRLPKEKGPLVYLNMKPNMF
ncbi:MAG: hypothetical protein QW502_01165 [Candidatus Bathyarchaeia archaeon]|nr:hypothetical protein [Candidatus Bathyarchaeota archaeon]